MNKKNYILNNASTTYFKYFFLKKLMSEEPTPTPEPVEGEGTDFTLKPSENKTFTIIKGKGNATQEASPSPDSPKAISVVTGTQTLTITKGSDIQTYTITLGSEELCKIGDYQDYIYKSDDDWYIHKDLGKKVFDGTENWNLSGTTLFTLGRNSIGAKGGTADILSDIATGNYNYGTNNNECYIGNSNIIFSKMQQNGSQIPSAQDWKTYLSENNSTFYFPLASATDTKITDETLLEELNTILSTGYLKKGTNHIVTSATGSNLPIIIYIKSN